ncbi:hypothetical protein AVEN_34540-1 [Araneus ventricosus]|uniref:C2H2-type domain-containing protein n=1 Tax=Araneus ventricosus TaxID=182803 RepID=A0A4Y2TAR0_ARAVE|nr:hypothetical protein AVEN_34540-1 [Araneus ventricosus]
MNVLALPDDNTLIPVSSPNIPVIGVPSGDASSCVSIPPSSGTSASASKKKKVVIKCDVSGCDETRKNSKGMHLHKLYKHKISIHKPVHPTQPSQDISPDDTLLPSDNANAPAESQTSHNDDDNTSSLTSSSCPSQSQRIGNVVDFLFPLPNPMKCTEPGCTFDSVSGVTWNQIKCSLLRHLKATHCFTKLKSRHWCATYGHKIKVPKKHACLALGATIDSDCEHKCHHPDCSFSSPTVLGLRNHTAAHRKSEALAASVQRKIPNIVKSKKRSKKLQKQDNDIPDESISDPTVPLAALPSPSDNNQAPPVASPQPEPGPLAIYIQALEAILQQDPSDEVFVHFCETVEQAVSEVQKISLPDDFGAPAPQEPRKPRKPVSVKDAQSAQLLYRLVWLSNWCEKYRVLSPSQKGFTPFDGVLEHNLILQTRLEQARTRKQDLCVAWLDVTNAFGALPHQLIYSALSAAGTGSAFVNIIKDIYNDCSSKILSSDSATSPISIKSEVKQGCPMSGILFNLSIDHILRRIQGPTPEHRVLVFADDLCLLASSPEPVRHARSYAFSISKNIETRWFLLTNALRICVGQRLTDLCGNHSATERCILVFLIQRQGEHLPCVQVSYIDSS